MNMFTSLEGADPSCPFVIGQLGQSLDGRIATVSGDARDIGGPAGLRHLHALRARVDAVVVGASTVLADDPRLTVRLVQGPSPARVVIDPRGRLGPDGKWLAEDGIRRILLTSSGSPGATGAEIVHLPALEGGGFAPADIVATLFARGLRRILIEGGAMTLSRFVACDALDRLHIVISPLIIGSGKAAIELPDILKLSQALRPRTQVFPLEGGDVLFDCDMRRGQS